MKKLIAVFMCVVMLLMVFTSCTTTKNEEDKGAVINMYLTHEVYNFDPVYAYKNDSALQLADLMFASLFYIDENGKVKNELASDWKVDKEKNMVTITIDDGAYWSDGVYVTANDFVYTIKRILNPEFTCDAASLLFDIKNARAVKNSTEALYVDDLGIDAVSEKEITINFEDGFSDYDGFKRTLASPIFAPLREDIVKVNEGDWAKKPSTMTCSGPFMLRKISHAEDAKGFILERNQYYFREKDQKLDKSVVPYRIVVDYTKTAEEQYNLFKAGKLFYVGNIAMSLRKGDIKNLVVNDAMSTAVIYLNQDFCLGKEIRRKDAEFVGKIEEPSEELREFDENGLPILVQKISEYYTYFNHMTPEQYAEKYDGAEYSYHAAKDYPSYSDSPSFFATNYEKQSDKTELVKMEYNGEERTIAITTEERVYVVKDENHNIIAYKYDINDGEYLFAMEDVRQALSKVIDREKLASDIVYAKAAGALVPNKIYNTNNRKQTFRDSGKSDFISTKADLGAAEAHVQSANAILTEKYGTTISDYKFRFTVRAEDEVHCYMADALYEAWVALGFNIEYEKIVPAVNDDMSAAGEVPTDIRDDIINEELYAGTFHATIVDLVAPDVTAMSVLAPFATDYAGTAIDMLAEDAEGNRIYKIEGHVTGYDSEAYNAKIEAAFAEKNADARAALLHEAEEILMKDLPVIPLVYNKEAYVVSKELSKVKNTGIGTRIFTNAKLKNYEKYLPEETN